MKLSPMPFKVNLIHKITKQKYVFYKSTTVDLEWDEKVFDYETQEESSRKSNQVSFI